MGSSKENHNEVIMTSLQRTIKWSHEGIRYFSDKLLIFILVKEIVLYTGKSPLEAPFNFVRWCNCPLSVNPLMISIGQEYMSLRLRYRCIYTVFTASSEEDKMADL